MNLFKNSCRYIFKDKILLIFIGIGSLLSLLPFLADGWHGCVDNVCGFIVGTNYRDGIWYQAVAATAFKSFPFRMPNFSGEPLTGYHYIPNLISYLLTFIGIPVSFSFYQLFPTVYMAGIILLSVIYARTIKDNPFFVRLFFFFTLFGIPLTILTSLYHKGYIDNYVLINTFQSTRILESIHFAFSFLILLSILILIQKKFNTWKQRLLIGLLVFLVFGIKFYTAVAIVLILGINELLIFLQKRDITIFLLNGMTYSLGAIIALFLFYDPFNANHSGSIFIFSPFATVHHIVEEPDLIYMKDMVNARYFLLEHGWSPRLLLIELFSTFLFTLFYFGTRFLGFIYILKQILVKKITRFELVLTITILICIAFSVLFIQKGDWFNPIQFSVVASFIMNVFVALFLYDMWKYKRSLFFIIFIPVFLLTFPSNLVNATYLSSKARNVIPNYEMEALGFLKKQPDGAVFAPIIDQDMAYVAAFSGKPTYVNFTNVLENTGIDFQERLLKVEHIESIQIDSLEVKYIYITDRYPKHIILEEKAQKSKKFKEIFRNEKVVIFEKTK